MSLAGANVLITGGLGFIGSNLARRLLADGARVTLCDALIEGYGGNPRTSPRSATDVEVDAPTCATPPRWSAWSRDATSSSTSPPRSPT